MEDKNSEMKDPELKDSSNESLKPASGSADASVKAAKKALTTRGMILIGIGGLLAILLIVGAAAWYTRISVVNQISVDAAQFDFKANYSDKDFIIRAEDYTNVYGTNKAAPGTAGVIPILVQAGDSNVDVDYILKLNTSTMDDEFKRRIRFFYIPYEDKDKAWNGTTYDPQYEKEFGSGNTITGTLKGADEPDPDDPRASHYEYIYWEWVYDLNPYRFYSQDDQKWYASDTDTYESKFNSEYVDPSNPTLNIDKFDEFDTHVGRGDFDGDYDAKYDGKVKHLASSSQAYYEYDEATQQYVEKEGILKAYQKAMECKVDITGAMAQPTYDHNPVDEPGKVGPIDGGKCGSAYIDLKEVINQHNLVHLPN